MYCRNCGAKLDDGAKFCTECGTGTAPETAAPTTEKEDRPLTTGENGFVPSGGAAPGGTAANTPGSDARTAQQTEPPMPGNTQGAYVSPAPGNGPGPTQPSIPGTAQGGYPPPAPGQTPPSARPAAGPYAAQAPVAGAPQKKKPGPLAVVLIILGALLVVVVLLFVFFTVIRKTPTPTGPVLTEPTQVTAAAETDTEKDAATTAAEPTAAGQTAAETTTAGQEQPATAAPADNGAGTHAAVKDTPLTDAQIKELKEKTVGFWNSADKKTFIGVTRMDQGLYYFMHGYWYSEADLVGYLQQPAKGDLGSTVSIHLFFEGFESEETGYSMPDVDTDVLFDFSRLDENVIGWNINGEWEDFTYGGATMEEAMPPFEQVFPE